MWQDVSTWMAVIDSERKGMMLRVTRIIKLGFTFGNLDYVNRAVTLTIMRVASILDCDRIGDSSISALNPNVHIIRHDRLPVHLIPFPQHIFLQGRYLLLQRNLFPSQSLHFMFKFTLLPFQILQIKCKNIIKYLHIMHAHWVSTWLAQDEKVIMSASSWCMYLLFYASIVLLTHASRLGKYLFLIPLLTFAVTNNSLHENYRLEILHRVIKTVCTRYYNCYEQTWYFSSLLYKIYKFIIKNAWVNVFSVWWKNVVLFAMQMKIRKQVWPIVNTWNHWKVFLTWQLNQPRPARKHEILFLLLPHHTIQTVSGACGIFFSCVVLWCGKTLNKMTTLTANRYLNSAKIQQVSLFLGWGSSCPSRMIFFPGVA